MATCGGDSALSSRKRRTVVGSPTRNHIELRSKEGGVSEVSGVTNQLGGKKPLCVGEQLDVARD